MKKFTTVTVLLMFLVVVSACNKTNNAKTEQNEVIAQGAIAEMKKLSLDIDGMTCEIGCARTIQSKLSKTEGIKLAQVNFSEKKGIVEYDANIITEKEIIATVEKIADGDLYKVTNTSEVE